MHTLICIHSLENIMLDTIRKANYDLDGKQIFDIVNDAYKIQIGSEGICFTNSPRWSFPVDSQAMKDEIKHIFVYLSEGEIIGCIKAEIISSKVVIGPIAVAIAHQGKKIGTYLLDFAEKLALVSQVEVVSCLTDVLPYYKKRGYVEIERYPLTREIPRNQLTRTDLEFIVLERK